MLALEFLQFAADGIARLYAPHAEVVVHDLGTGKIRYIANCFSKRRAGDPSLTNDTDLDLNQAVIGPYSKTNWDGRRLRSISIVLRDDNGAPAALLCINQDIEAFSAALDQLTSLVAPPVPMKQASELFAADWRERINDRVGAFLTKRNLTLAGLDADSTMEMVGELDRSGYFAIRNAVTYVATLLGVSRSTLYNRLSVSRRNVASSSETIDSA